MLHSPRTDPDRFHSFATQLASDAAAELEAVADVTVVSSRERILSGTASPLSRVAVVSTNRLSRTGRDQPRRSLDTPAARWNDATLLLQVVRSVTA